MEEHKQLEEKTEAVSTTSNGFSRRRFLGGTAGMTLMAVTGSLLAGCEKADDQLTKDSFNGLLAMIVPGDDEYSKQQGVTLPQPGGVGAKVAPFLINTYHESVPINLTRSTDVDPYIESFVALTLNDVAREVKPFTYGPFLSTFANLQFRDKIEVLRRLEEEQPLYRGTIITFLFNTLPTLTAFLAYSEAAVLDPETRTLTGRPVGWEISRYPGVADGRDEFIGYYRGVQKNAGGA